MKMKFKLFSEGVPSIDVFTEMQTCINFLEEVKSCVEQKSINDQNFKYFDAHLTKAIEAIAKRRENGINYELRNSGGREL